MDGSRRKRLILLAVLIAVGALVARVGTIREPLNSDDNQYLTGARLLLEGRLPIQSPIRPTTEVAGNHHHLRLGMILPLAALYAVFGLNVVTYYAMPLAFCVLGVLLTFGIVRHFAGETTAFVAALFQIVNPLEAIHGTSLLTDMPTAVLSIAYFALLLPVFEGRVQSRRTTWILGLLGGVVLLWVYMLRSNGLVFLFPLVAVGLYSERTRTPVLLGIILVGAGIGIEQLAYWLNGGEFGYRFKVTAAAVERYRPHLPVTPNLSGYLLRYFIAIEARTNVTVLCLFVFSILAHAWVIALGRNLWVRALAVCGLSALGVFWFAVFGPVSDGFVTQPAFVRYIQLFFSTSVICGPLAVVDWGRGLRARFRPQSTTPRRAARLAWFAFLFLLMIPMGRSAMRSRRIFLSSSGYYYPVLKELRRYMQDHDLESVEIMGTLGGVQAIRIFTWLPFGHSIRWTEVEVSELREIARRNPDQLFISNLVREEQWLKYEDPDSARYRQMRADYESLERFVKEETEVLARSKRLVLGRWRPPHGVETGGDEADGDASGGPDSEGPAPGTTQPRGR